MCLPAGFNTLVDLTYPLTTQTILTDGQHWQFLAYQLNTLELWKNNDANNFNNICWVSDEAKLYAGVEEGKVQGFNSDVLRQLIAFLALAPSDRPYDLRPTLPPTAVNPKDKKEFIPLKKEKVVVVEEEKYVIADWCAWSRLELTSAFAGAVSTSSLPGPVLGLVWAYIWGLNWIWIGSLMLSL